MSDEPESNQRPAADQHRRSVAKAVSWRIVGTIDTMVIAWLITGKPIMALSIGGVELITKMYLYYLHERCWARIKWGRA